jgi:ABC-2 type transport system ATP-binding protein
VIDVRNFHKVYGNKAAVQGLSFCVEPGQILGLVGPNGAGKTTTLRALTGLIYPSRGKLTVAGYDIERDPVRAKQHLAYIPDDAELFDDLTVAEHLAFAARVYGVTEYQDKARPLLDKFDLSEQMKTRCRDLSRGMRQKLAVCCAYLHDPRAILFDEPLTGLDPPGIRNLKLTIRQRAVQGAAVMISSHLLAMVEDLCTHVLILQRGTARFFGTIEELKEAYRRDGMQISLEDIFFEATQSAPELEATAGNAGALVGAAANVSCDGDQECGWS